MSKKKPTQNDEAQVEINRLLANEKQLRSIQKNLHDILERAEDSEPYTAGDGSISVQARADLRRVARGLEALLRDARTACWPTRDR